MKLSNTQVAFLLVGVALVFFLLRKTNATPTRVKREIDPDIAEEKAFENELDLFGEGWINDDELPLPTIPVSNIPIPDVPNNPIPDVPNNPIPDDMEEWPVIVDDLDGWDNIGGIRIPRYRRPDGLQRRHEDRKIGMPPDRAQLDIAVYNAAWQRDDRDREKRMFNQMGKRANVLLGVETFDSPIRSYLDREWHVLQNRADKGQANSSVASRDVRVLDSGYAPTVDKIAGVQLRKRWIAWQYLKMSDGTIVRVGAYHRPPPRFAWTWPLYDRAVIAWLNITRQPTVLGGDFNSRTLERITRATGYRYVNTGVMGALVSPDLRVVDRWSDEYRASDHPVMGFSVRKKRK